LAALKPEVIASAILNDIGPVIDPAGIKRIATYAGNVGPFDTWQSLASQIRILQGPFYPDADNAFWLTFARRCAKERGPNEIVFDYDPAIAQATSASAGPAPDLMPYFAALAPKPVLVVRGALSDILSAEGLAAMQGVKADLAFCEVARVGHAPTLEEPDAKVAIAAFLKKVS
jgi:pimeloyl-ACP methyl ester carboxylesterase